MRRQTLHVLADAAYAAGAGFDSSVAQTVMALTEPVTHHNASALMIWDPNTGRHREATAFGYSSATLTGLGDRYAATPEYRRLRTVKMPLRIDDLPYDYRSTEIFHDVLEPSGFADGMTVCLFEDNLTYRGMLHLSAQSRNTFDDDAADLIGALAPVIARLCGGVLSPLPRRESPVGLRAAVIDLLGVVHSEDQHAPPRSLDQPSFLDLIRRFRGLPFSTARGLWPSPDGWVAIELQKISVPLSNSPQTVRVEERAAPALFGLSPREIDILQGIALGNSNQQIAQARSISVRTVSTHVERILQKMDQRSRAGAISVAAHNGLLFLDL
ncbi:MAG: LuxR C-terminal-related transcriptional regulator [Lacisediminihabitans sp.]